MQGNVVSAARWLGASILLASLILVSGLRGVHLVETRALPVGPAAVPVEVGHFPKADPTIVRTSSEGAPERASALIECEPKLGCDGYVTQRRVALLGPATGEATPATCLDPPSVVEIWEKFDADHPKLSTTFPLQRNNVRIAFEKIGEKVDPCKVFPLAGRCELVHCRYKCTISFDERSSIDSPIPFGIVKHRVEVVYIDKDHLRRCGGPTDSTIAP